MASKELATLFVGIRAETSKFAGDINGLKSKTKSGFMGLAKGVGAAMAGVGLAIGGVALNTAAKFDEANKILMNGTGQTGAALAELKSATEGVYAATTLGAAESAEVVALLNSRFGMTGDAAQEMGTAIGLVSEKTGTVAEYLADKITSIGRAFEMPDTELPDLLAHIANQSEKAGVSVDKMLNPMKTYSAALKQAGLSSQQAVALIADLESKGLSTEKVMTGLSVAVRKLSQNDYAGIDGISDGIQKWSEGLTEITNKNARLSEATRAFGEEGGLAVVTALEAGIDLFPQLADTGVDSMEELAQNVNNSRTAAEQFAQTMKEVKLSLLPMGTQMLLIATEHLPKVIDGWKMLIALFKSEVLPVLQQVTSVAKDHIIPAWNAVAGVVGSTVNGLRSHFRDMSSDYNTALNHMAGGTASTGTKITTVVNAIGSAARGALSNLTSLFTSAGQSGVTTTAAKDAVGSAFSSQGIPGFATGGSFTVGGGSVASGPVDSQYINFMASPGEHVSVMTPGQMRAAKNKAEAMSGQNITQNINVSTGVQETVRAELLSMMPQMRRDMLANMNSQFRLNTKTLSNLRKNI